MVQARLENTKATEEVRALEAFYKMMKNEQSRAFYGPKHVLAACEAEAIEVLLISDKLFRANNVQERKKFVDLVDKVGICCSIQPVVLIWPYLQTFGIEKRDKYMALNLP